MPIYKDGNNFKVIKDGRDFDLPQAEVATKAEMEAYILDMAPADIEASGNDLIITFMPFPTKYINYIKQKQYHGKRTQVFWQLVRYVGRAIYRRTNVFSTQGPSSVGWRQNDNSDLYHWSFPTRRLVGVNGESAEGSMEPYSFNLTPQQATLGRIVWCGGYTTIFRFIKRPWLARYNTTPRKIAVILGVSRHGMRDSSTPWVYKKSNDFEYNDEGPIIPTPLEGIPLLISNAEVLLEPDGDDYFISFSNIDQDLLNYAEQNKLNKNSAIFVQTFNYVGGQTHGREKSNGERKNIKSPVKNQFHRKDIGALELQNGLFLSDIIVDLGETVRGWRLKGLRARYNKGDPETFHNISVALVLANTGMNEGFHIYKESNKVNII